MLFRGLSPAASAAGAGAVMQPKPSAEESPKASALADRFLFGGAFLHIFFCFRGYCLHLYRWFWEIYAMKLFLEY